MNDVGRARAVREGLRLEVRERDAEVVAVAVDEHYLPAALDDRQRRRHERVRRAQDGLPAHGGIGKGGERRARPAREPDRGHAVPAGPGLLEAAGQITLRPALRIEDLVPQLVEPRAIAMVEPDGELVDAHGQPARGQVHDTRRVGDDVENRSQGELWVVRAPRPSQGGIGRPSGQHPVRGDAREPARPCDRWPETGSRGRPPTPRQPRTSPGHLPLDRQGCIHDADDPDFVAALELLDLRVG